jgi:hypothetical protein
LFERFLQIKLKQNLWLDQAQGYIIWMLLLGLGWIGSKSSNGYGGCDHGKIAESMNPPCKISFAKYHTFK